MFLMAVVVATSIFAFGATPAPEQEVIEQKRLSQAVKAAVFCWPDKVWPFRDFRTGETLRATIDYPSAEFPSGRIHLLREDCNRLQLIEQRRLPRSDLFKQQIAIALFILIHERAHLWDFQEGKFSEVALANTVHYQAEEKRASCRAARNYLKISRRLDIPNYGKELFDYIAPLQELVTSPACYPSGW